MATAVSSFLTATATELPAAEYQKFVGRMKGIVGNENVLPGRGAGLSLADGVLVSDS